MNKFLTSNSASMRLARTIVQAVIGVLISYADIIVGQAAINPELRPMIVALVMAVLSPVMAVLGENGTETPKAKEEPEQTELTEEEIDEILDAYIDEIEQEEGEE